MGRPVPDYVRAAVLRSYLHKYKTTPEFRDWLTKYDGFCTNHYGQFAIEMDSTLWHLRSQLYELTSTAGRRMGLAPGNKASMIDVGASDALFLSYLQPGSSVGLNILPECTKQIRTQGYRACRGDLENLPFQSKTFDYVLCFETLEHVPNPVRALREMGRICRCRVFLSVPHLSTTRINALPANELERGGHIFEFDEADFRKVVSHSNLRITHHEDIRVFPGSRNVFDEMLLRQYFYPGHFRKLQYYELEPTYNLERT